MKNQNSDLNQTRRSSFGFEDVERARFDYDLDSKHSKSFFNVAQIKNAIVLPTEFSCASGLSRPQKQGLRLIGSSLGIVGLFDLPLLLSGLSGVLWLIFAGLILWRLALLSLGLRLLVRRRRRPVRVGPPDPVPVYSVMVAVYREAPVMAQLAAALRALDWPEDRLDIQILLEVDDQDTLIAAKCAGFPRNTRFVVVPDGKPRTKPRALNFGLAQAYGRYICVYDAEDRPHPQQLRHAVAAFAAAGDDLACVQAPLVGDNGREGLIAAHWSLEYAVQFGLLLPALSALKLPIAIGGTSNHFDTQKLHAAGGWDAWNVTEDADLGFRFARLGWRVGMIGPPTLEDAPTSLSIWIGQRSRWIKGFIQTWLVLMRRPRLAYKQMGAPSFAAMQISLGGAILAPILHGPLFCLSVAALFTSALSPGPMGWSLLITGLLVGLFADVTAPGQWSKMRLLAVITRPFYWPLHSIAAAKALFELAVRPHFWAKTPHTPHTPTATPKVPPAATDDVDG